MEFREEEAVQYGVSEAIMISYFRYWIAKNKANEKHNYDGFTWTYNSNKAFQEIFKFWTEKQIRNILDSLKKQKIIKTGNYNKAGFDRTTWYAFVDEDRFLSIGQIGQMELPKRANGIAQKGEPIPISIPISNNTINKKKKNNKKKKTKKFIPPTLEEVKAYCEERKNNVDAKKFFDYYSVSDWKNSQGKQILNWKQTLIANWEGKATTYISKPQESNPYYQRSPEEIAKTEEYIRQCEMAAGLYVEGDPRYESWQDYFEKTTGKKVDNIEGLEDW